MFTGRKKSRFSVIDPLKRKQRESIHIFRIVQAFTSLAVLVLFYFIPPKLRDDVVVETCYPAVFMLLFFRVLTSPTAKVSFYYNLYVNTIATGLYSVVGSNDLYMGLVERPAPHNIYMHYTRLNLMLITCFLITADVLYIEFYEKNARILPEKMSVGDAMRARIEIAIKKYNEDVAKREQEDAEREAAAAESRKQARQPTITLPPDPDPAEEGPSTSKDQKKPRRWF
ncbi:hypothetical protein GE061_017095 [Apolygus lucorum]|uniref:Uncharacterized protein n=1 Tax=Apolygus lucorum TaxID=248454 RepID=A0A6A4IZ72_APOLU|nr:hypothetical protein GE061_017095 [Apolygus lucorum]